MTLYSFMKRFSNILLFLTILLLITQNSCKENETFPVIPHIEYLGFMKLQTEAGIDSLGILRFSFTDGDGDLGYPSGSANPQYDLFISYFELNNGVLVPYITPSGDTIQFNARLPYLTPDIANKTIKGEIEDTLSINNPVSDNDTILFRIYITDRAGNQSNTIETPLINIIKR